MMPASRRSLALGLTLLAALWAMGAPAATRFEGEGRVIAVDLGAGTITIDHGPIPGLLPATRTVFAAGRPEMGSMVRPGEYIRFVLSAADESHGRLALTALSTTRRPWLEALPLALALAALGLVALGAVAGFALWRVVQDLRKRTESVAYEVRHARQGLIETREDLHGVARAMDAMATTVLEGYLKDVRRRIQAARGPRSVESPPGLIVVRRGRMDVYRALDGAPGVRVIWDRRVADRRARRQAVVSERRRAERRRAGPEAWTKLGFTLIVEASGLAADGPEPAPSRPARAAGLEPPV